MFPAVNDSAVATDRPCSSTTAANCLHISSRSLSEGSSGRGSPFICCSSCCPIGDLDKKLEVLECQFQPCPTAHCHLVNCTLRKCVGRTRRSHRPPVTGVRVAGAARSLRFRY